MSAPYIMALDLGTTGNRALLFDSMGQPVAQAYQELTQHYPQPGWVEHDALEIWQQTRWVMQKAIERAGVTAQQIAAIGLTVQRETCLLWDKQTGQPLHRAIVWQDRRTAPHCQQLANQVAEIYERTGLVLDAYFSATKLAWLLDHLQSQPDVDLDSAIAGTIDTWILWNLTGGRVHATDHSNASRTLLMNLASLEWDDTLLDLFGIPRRLLPAIQPSMGRFGHTDPDVFGVEIPITAVFGDQQAALFAHGCDRKGLMKCTYGTGSFLMAATETEIARSQHQLLSTIAWTTTQTPARYALEGSMFTSGACVQWLRDGLQLIDTAAESAAIAAQVADNGGVYFVPALSGLGTPHWDMGARGAFLGMTRGVERAHLVRAVLEAIAYQTREVVEAINTDSGTAVQQLKVDGGACQNDLLMQIQADVLGIPVERPQVLDATAQGAAFGAGLAVGLWSDYQGLVQQRQIDRVFEPSGDSARWQAHFTTWQRAVERSKGWIS